MPSNIKLKEATKSDLKEIRNLIIKSFENFEKKNFTKEGGDKFLQNIKEEELKERRNSGSRFVIAIDEEEKIIGVMEVRPYNYINLFYLNKENLEVCEKLLKECISYCDFPNVINAPSYLEKTFEKIGLVKVCNRQEIDGIKFTPYKYQKNNGIIGRG